MRWYPLLHLQEQDETSPVVEPVNIAKLLLGEDGGKDYWVGPELSESLSQDSDEYNLPRSRCRSDAIFLSSSPSSTLPRTRAFGIQIAREKKSTFGPLLIDVFWWIYGESAAIGILKLQHTIDRRRRLVSGCICRSKFSTPVEAMNRLAVIYLKSCHPSGKHTIELLPPARIRKHLFAVNIQCVFRGFVARRWYRTYKAHVETRLQTSFSQVRKKMSGNMAPEYLIESGPSDFKLGLSRQASFQSAAEGFGPGCRNSAAWVARELLFHGEHR